jgi:large subunit ribosomal protein L19
LETRGIKSGIPTFRAGSTVRVHVRVVEGKKERIQVFEGVVMGISGTGLRKTFTVRKISNGVGIDRAFPVHSPIIDRIEVLQHGKVRQGKLNYLRGRSGKRARLQEISREKREKMKNADNASQ